MVIDNNSDRFLSNAKNLQVSTQFSNYVDKNQLFNSQLNFNHLNQINNCLNQTNQMHQVSNQNNNQINQTNQANNQLNYQSNNQINNQASHQHNHTKHPNDHPDQKMNNQFNDKPNLANNPFKDSTQSVNIPILLNQTKALDDSEDENDDILEISPCGRWSKRRDQVEQHDIPNLDNSYLAIDGEEGLEVVWNEVRISERKYLQTNEARIHKVFSRLIQLNHNNIVKIHKYWMDKENPRLIFITEYMSGGTLRLFLKKTRSNFFKTKMTVVTWRRWCTQILCALRYLHAQKHPKPIIHGDTIFISHTGLIKIGCVNPDLIHQNVKTMGANTMANFKLLAPEMMNENTTEDELNDMGDGIFNKTYSSAIDIYAFGIVALEMAVYGIKNNVHGNNKQNHQAHPHGHRYSEQAENCNTYNNYICELSGSSASRETIRKAIDLLDNDLQKDFINRCLNEDPRKRPTAKELLFHPIIFEVPCLKVICANKILNNSSTGYSIEQIDEEFNRKMQNTQSVIAEIHHQDGTNIVRRICDLSKLNTEYLEKFFEEVRSGVYPLYAFTSLKSKINKYIKLKRNSFKNLVENVQLNQVNKCNVNGLNENCNQPTNGEDVSNKQEEQFDELNNCNELDELNANDEEQECQDEEDEYDQETGSQNYENEDYETRDENLQDVYEEETRRIEQIEITLKSTTGQSLIHNNVDRLYCLDTNQEIIILLKLDDMTNRKLSCSLSTSSDNGTVLSNELVLNGFINSKDRDLVQDKINDALSKQNMSFTNLTDNQPAACYPE